MAERQVRDLLAMTMTSKGFDDIDALEEKRKRRGVIMKRRG